MTGAPAGGGGRAVVAYVPDMLDRSRVAAAGASVGADLRLVRSIEELREQVAASGAPLVVVDLGRPGVLELLAELEGLDTVGFASHVDRDLIRSARAAGCGRVLARSAFFRDLGTLLAPPLSSR